jgi:hypothetical protein
MKRRVALIAMIVGSFLTAASAQAADRFNIPFDFTVGKVTLPAGSYSVSPVGNIQTHLQLKNRDRNEGVFQRIDSVGLNPGRTSEATKLVFQHYGDQYFLAEFWKMGSTTGHTFSRSKAEREIARSVAQPKTEILSAGQ